MSAALIGLALLVMSAGGVMAQTTYRMLSFHDLTGWARDDQRVALAVFRKTCGLMKGPAWQAVCARAAGVKDARGFFERLFRPVLVDSGRKALFTGYFEPEINGSPQRTGRYRYPIYRRPAEARKKVWRTRAEIEQQGLLAGRGLEIAWLDDPVEAYFLQIQGSGRIHLTNGRTLRVGYGGSNGHVYRSLGRELVRRGILRAHKVSAAAIRAWVHRHPVEGRELLQHNPAYVFFREIRSGKPGDGPLGAMNRPLTALRSVAVDPAYIPLGAPVWIEKGGKRRIRRLMVAQDTGSAIRGAQRVDIFFGTGAGAGRLAGAVRDPGRVAVLFPTAMAEHLALNGVAK